MRLSILTLLTILSFGLSAQNTQNNPGSNHGNKFEQLSSILPTPNEYRTASGAPGPKYWQQRCDYDINCELDEKNLTLTGRERITYRNQSPDALQYLWLQLDENEHSTVNNANYQGSNTMNRRMSPAALDKIEESYRDNGYGVKITRVVDSNGRQLDYVINKTMMRVELPKSLKPGQIFVFNIDWNYKIADRMTLGGRGGYEYFPEDGNYLFTIAQWYPRLCVYSDFQGWQNHQFTGRGEFALTFGDFNVKMTVPADHIIGSTGECQNYSRVLTPAQLARWRKAQTSKDVVEIVTLDEAKAAEKNNTTAKKTWHYKAKNVRDFAWGSSPKFVWDAMPVNIEGRKVMAMSLYGKEAYGLYRPYSTKVVAHTIKTYSDFTIPYPYPVAQSVEASNGMEYPMICFNYGRTEKDGTYSEGIKNGMIGVVIHEVGHNFFPMIINSDERQWSWMDEGLNTFVEYLAEELWDNKFPSRRGPAAYITDYMKLPKDQLEPIMTNSESIYQFGNNAYGKPATALNILRETIMGRELFDYAFKTYCERWKFKHPTPADFFRTMEDASAVDLDWFWRGWFYGTDNVDISIDEVKYFQLNTQNPTVEKQFNKSKNENKDLFIGDERNKTSISETVNEKDTTIDDFYAKRNIYAVDALDKKEYETFLAKIDPKDLELLNSNKHFYEVSFSNIGGLVMPLIMEFTFSDDTKQVIRIPAEIWRKSEEKVSKVFILDKDVISFRLDPFLETADTDLDNNTWPKKVLPSRYQLFKQQETQGNPMQRQKKLDALEK